MENNMRIRSIWCAVCLLALPLYEALGDDPTCGEPPTIDLASLTSLVSSENAVGTSVTYTCQFGYVIQGASRTLTCELTNNGEEAKWSDPQVTCIPRSCGDPGYVTNGHRLGSLFSFPNSVSYECEEGFRLQGNGRRFCQASGSWSGRLPQCEAIFCDPPNNPENGRVTYASLEVGAHLKFECNIGYALDDTSPVHCRSNGTWNKTNVACIEKKCDVPQKPEHGNMEFIGSATSPKAGTIAVFTCEEGRIASGPTSSKCLSTGEWTFPAPLCLGPCNIPFVLNGKIGKWVSRPFGRSEIFQEVPVGQRIEDGDELFLNCDDGYVPLVDTTNRKAKVVCKGGKWSDNPLCELSTCKAEPPEVENGRVEKIDRKHGGIVSYECLPNFSTVKVGNVTCNMGEWKGMLPTCKYGPCNIPFVLNGKIGKWVSRSLGRSEIFQEVLVGQEIEDGDELFLNCDDGYIPLVDTTNRKTKVVCKGGKWSDNPLCELSTCKTEPPELENGKIEKMDRKHGGIVSYECLPNFVKVKVGNVTCNMGEWKGMPPTCKDAICKAEPPEVENGRIEKMNRNHDGIVSYECLPNFIKVKAGNVKCNMGEWMGLPPTCKDATNFFHIEPCSIPFVQNGKIGKYVSTLWGLGKKYQEVPVGQMIEDGDELFLRCYRYYSPLGDITNSEAMVVCRGGKWSDDPFCDLGRCLAQQVRNTRGVASISDVTLHGNLLQVHCKEGYEPRPNRQKCLEGYWRNNQESPCKEKGCMVPRISNGKIVKQILERSKYNWWEMEWEYKETYETVRVGSVSSRDATLFLVCGLRHYTHGRRSSVRITCSKGRWSHDLLCQTTGSLYTKSNEALGSANISQVTEKSLTTARTTTTSEASTFVSGTVGSNSTTTTGTPVSSEVPGEAVPTNSKKWEDECSCQGCQAKISQKRFEK